jgi:hypothetical protein
LDAWTRFGHQGILTGMQAMGKGKNMSALFSSPKKPAPVAPPSTSQPEVQQRAAEARRRAALARGRSSTNLVGLGNVGA